jgi:hypothetical protein
MDEDADPLTLAGAERALSSLTADGGRLVGAVAENAGSDGFLEHIFRHAAQELFQVRRPSRGSHMIISSVCRAVLWLCLPLRGLMIIRSSAVLWLVTAGGDSS